MSLSTGDLARLEIENELLLWERAATLMTSGASGRDTSVAWFATGLPLAFCNQALTIGEAVAPGSLERAVSGLRARGQPFYVRIRAGTDDGIVPQLERLGLREEPDERTPGMALYPLSAADAATTDASSPGLEIRQVFDEAALEDHLGVVAAGFELPLELVRRFFPREELDLPGIAVFTGYAASRPVASALGFTAGATVGVYNVATVADARRHGYGGAITRHVIADGVRRGASVAILQSSAMGRHLYESLGFREVVAYRVFGDRGGAPAAA